MSRKFLTAIDLSKNELQNAVVQNLASAPSSPVKGQLYFDSVGNILYWWNGAAWVAAQGGAGVGYGATQPETTFGIARSDGVATTVARSDHTHGSPAHSAAEHSTIPISALAAATANVSMGGFTLTNVANPVSPSDAASKAYVDFAIQGLAWKDSVRVASTANQATSGLAAIDGVVPIAGDRILLKNQTLGTENGIWVAASAAWARAIDADAAGELDGAAVYVMEGTAQGDTAWVCTTNGPIIPGTTATVWAQFAGGGTVGAGAGLTMTGNAINVIGDSTMTVVADSLGVANDGITNAKLANMPALTVKGNDGGAAADPKDLTIAELIGLITFTGGMPRKFAATLATSATSYTVLHAFNTKDLTVNVYRVATPFDTVECDVERTDTNNVTLRFATAPAANEYRVVVLG